MLDKDITETPVPAPLLVHPILTDEQAVLVHQALLAFLNTPEGDLSENPAEEMRVKQMLSELVFFFSTVVEHPEQFGLRSKDDNKRIIRAHKAGTKGPAQPKSQRNKRKARQARRTGAAKRRRKENRENLQNYNEAVQRMEADRKEAEEAYEAAKQRFIDRFESLAKKETLSNEELQEVLELFGSPEAAERVRELRAGDTPEARLAAAAAAAGQPDA